MKKLFGAALALISSVALGATLVPVQLLNPTGSSSGQAIVSTGASSAPAWGGIGLNGIAAIAANTVLANATASSAAPTAFAMPSCSTSASALTWTTSTGFTCNTSVNAATLGGATFAAPGPIGSTTASTGAFTTLTSTTSGSTSSLTVTDTGASGSNIKIVGNGATTPAKTMRVSSGVFQILNNAYTTILMNLDDAGNATFNGLVKATTASHLNYKNSSGQSIPVTTPTTITGWTSVFDSNSNFNASTGVFTAPNTAYYLISGQLAMNLSGTVSVNNQVQLLVIANGVTVGTFSTDVTSTSQVVIYVPFSILVSLTGAQTVSVQAVNLTGSAQTLVSSTTTANVLSIVQIP